MKRESLRPWLLIVGMCREPSRACSVFIRSPTDLFTREEMPMGIRYFALVYGTVFAIAGIAGFIPFLVTPYGIGEPSLTVTAGAGKLLGLFPINVLHNLVHIAFGIWGLAIWKSLDNSRIYARSVAVIYGLLTLMGLFSGLQTTFGLIPLQSHDVWLHLVLAAVAAYFGWGYTSEAVAHRQRH